MSAMDSRDLSESVRRVWIAPAANLAGAPVPPANTVALGGPMPAGWRHVGYTAREPLVLGSPSAEKTPVYSGEQRGQIASFMGEVSETVTFRILSRTMQNIKDMAGRGELSQIAAGSGTPGEIRYKLTDAASDQTQLLIEWINTRGRLARAHYPVGSFSITDGLQIGLGADVAGSGLAVTFTAEGGPSYPVAWWEVLPALP